ncbi:MAG: DnaJ domain-containing protein [Burkholderiales bacterium]|nr:DnaJ domain-containing protein [Burkholderiales bacterium]
MEFRNYYEILGVRKDASQDEIKKAFRKLARRYHPDVSREADAERRMKEINEAYTVLSDPEKRAAYDRIGQGYRQGQDFRPPPDWDAGFEFSGKGFDPREAAGFSDFFSQIFGRMGGQPRRADHHAKVLLDLEDAYRGAVRQIALRVPKMDASGHVLLENRTLNVKIPKGVHEGQIIRLAGQAGQGGDLLLEVHFRQHERFSVEGLDVHLALPVAPWEAALGAIVQVGMPDGDLKVRIPPGTRGGRPLRVHGKGIPGNPPGDLILKTEIVLPPADTPAAKAFYEKMAREFPFDPRGRAE